MSDILSALDNVLEERKKAAPDSSYVSSLYHKGLNKILEKVGEEATETIISAKTLNKAKIIAISFMKRLIFGFTHS